MNHMPGRVACPFVGVLEPVDRVPTLWSPSPGRRGVPAWSRVWLGQLAVCAVLLAPRGIAAQAAEGTGAGPAEPSEPATDEIVRRALETSTIGFQTGESTLRLTVRDHRGDERQRRMVVRSREEDSLNRSLVRLIAPPDLAGQSYLFVENRDRRSDIWTYLPALDDEPRRISSSQQNESFLGSNITYADLTGRDISQAAHTRQADEELATFAVYVVDSVPEDSAYARIRQWIRQTDYVPMRVRYFDDDGSEVKTLFAEEVDTHQGRTYVRQMTMVHRDESASTVSIESIDFEAAVSETEFTRENLTR